MNNTFFQLKSFFNYFLDNVDEHSLHSPFFFKFYTQVLKTPLRSESIARLESYRKKLLEDDRSIIVEDLGAGSAYFKTNSSRKVSDIARTSLSPQKFSNLYSKIIKEYDYKNVIELGTSLGLNTSYLALSATTHVRTFEGSESVAGIAEELFGFVGSQNIKLVRGDIDLTLSAELGATDNLDFALIDANHRYAPTMNYFDMIASKLSARGMVVLDDIHASQQMEKAWKAIREDTRVHATADLYRCGLAFFDPSLDKQHVVLRF